MLRCISRLACLIALFAGACSVPSDLEVGRVQVTPGSLDMSAGDAQALTARVVDREGNPVTRQVHWSSSDPSIARVSAAGLVEGVGAGTTQVAASAGGQFGVVTVRVQAGRITLVRVTPAATELEVGAVVNLVAEAIRADGTATRGTPKWSSDSPTIASASATGQVTALAPGVTTISADIEGVVGTALVRVQASPVAVVTLTPPTLSLLLGQSATLDARVRTANGAQVSDRPISWVSRSPQVASVSSAGVVTSLSEGTAHIVATVEGKADSVVVTSQRAPVASLRILPSTAVLATGRQATLIAQQFDSTGKLLAPRPVFWRSDAPAVAVVDSLGTVTAIQPGTARIQATAQGVSGSATVTVNAIPVARVAVTPATASLLEGDSIQLTATAFDASGSVLAGRPVLWTSGGPTVATVGATGRVITVGRGSVLIFASIEGTMASASLTVSRRGPAPVASVSVSPSSASLLTGQTLRLLLDLRDEDGNILTGRTVAWTASGPGVQVSASGVVTATAAGRTQVVATSEGIADTATITITPAPQPSQAALVIAPLTGTVRIGRAYARSVLAVVRDSLGATVPNASVRWTSSVPGALSVSGSGTTATITATGTPATGIMLIGTTGTSPALSDTILVGTDYVPIASLSVSPDSVSVPTGQGVTLLAIARDSAGNTVDTTAGNPLGNRTVAWRSNVSTATPSPATGRSTVVTPSAAARVVVTATMGSLTDTAVIVASDPTIAIAGIIPVGSTNIDIQRRSTQSRTARFVVVDVRQTGLGGIPFTVTSDDTSTVVAAASGVAVTDARGNGSFTVTLTSKAKRNDNIRVRVIAAGRSASWVVRVQ